ncbi:4Fe-4S binding domain containing protein [Trichomonas vaginalis G3]|uniref:4Fe-4S binding domain containing protein n=1 Tax=Trichomonas vaginalis (strain ATCC PRA-98 / G3) TaxID=412133 RepID=A2DV72_TRIV3|nr:FMN binding [Trichomonas vaginalis G3]EAY15668.1 4Fe-4S binding domain containing protein [Trichomonas vaginalis G3]KAI5504515.1 FMN binding [Trichomonas vaginalis G3]|eukprot:XP_001327891.1 4Fe-4S binding domain containing protein [Trichomonas vaginalis G3]
MLGPSPYGENSRAMTEAEIEDTINDFVNSAKIAELTGADGVQIDCGHGNLLSQFLSPALNQRTDSWGGDDENRLRIVHEIVKNIRKEVKKNFAISVKINGHDCIKGGVTPELAAKYIMKLPDVQMFEITCGVLNQMTSIRSRTNEESMTRNATEEQKVKIKKTASKADPEFPFYEGYNNKYTEEIRRIVGPNPTLAVVGGLRQFSMMEKIVKDGTVDFVALCRPFIRQPTIVAEFKKNATKSKCHSCGECSLKRPTNAIECTWPKF